MISTVTCYQTHSSVVARVTGNVNIHRIGHVTRHVTARLTNQKLDGQGRARREAARRRKSERKVNLGIRNSTRSNGS